MEFPALLSISYISLEVPNILFSKNFSHLHLCFLLYAYNMVFSSMNHSLSFVAKLAKCGISI